MTATVLTNARIVDPPRGLDEHGAVIVAKGKILAAGAAAHNQGAPDGAEVIDCSGKLVIPGLVDSRVFVGEPGAEHRETIASASHAAAAGGVTSIPAAIAVWVLARPQVFAAYLGFALTGALAAGFAYGMLAG